MAKQKTAVKSSAELRQKLVFEIEGMSCAACALRVEKQIKAQKGVTETAVNLPLRRAYVQCEPGLAAAEVIKSIETAIAKAGYKAHLAENAEHEEMRRHAHQGHNMHGGHHHGGFGAAAEAEERQETKRFWLAFALTLPVFLAEMSGHALMLTGIPANALTRFAAASFTLWAELILTALVLIIPGRHFFTMGIPPLLRGYPNMNSLVAVGAFAAWGYSAFMVVFGGAAPHVYFESAAVIITLILLGRALEARSRGKAGAAIAALAKLAPAEAKVKRGGKIKTIPVSAIKKGDEVIIRPWEKLPADGAVLEGASALDESMMTGEAFPIAKKQGDTVYAGTVNGAGTLSFRAENVGGHTALAQIQNMVAEAQAAKLPITVLADKITAWFVPAIFAAALLTFMAWLYFAPGRPVGAALIAAVSVLIIACPCAMGLAAPVAVIVGTGRAANLGVLFRRGDALQKLCETQVAAFDKTGTLTAGKPRLALFRAAAGFDEAEMRAKLAALEGKSEHPIAAAFAAQAAEMNLKVEDFAALPAKGVRGRVAETALAVGSEALMAELKADVKPLAAAAREAEAQGLSAVYAAVGSGRGRAQKWRAAALFAVDDPVRPQAKQAVAALKAQGLHIAVISGDNEAAARNLAEKLEIDDVRARVKPADKAAIMRDLQQQGKAVAFIGDGINDAPALSQADVGIAVGSGADAARQAADIVLMSGNPEAVVRAYGISRAVLRNIKQNLFWAFAYNVVLIPIAAGILVPFGGPGLSPAPAAAAMALSSLCVVGNALRLRRFSG